MQSAIENTSWTLAFSHTKKKQFLCCLPINNDGKYTWDVKK